MEYFTNEIRKKNEILARNVELMSSIESEEDFKKAVDLVSVRFNEEFIKGLISEDQLNKSFDTLDEIVKSRPHKYIRREGTPGNYMYIYKEPKGRKKKAEESTTEKQLKHSKSDPEGLSDFEDMIISIGQSVDESIYQNYLKSKEDAPRGVLEATKRLQEKWVGEGFDSAKDLLEDPDYRALKNFLTSSSGDWEEHEYTDDQQDLFMKIENWSDGYVSDEKILPIHDQLFGQFGEGYPIIKNKSKDSDKFKEQVSEKIEELYGNLDRGLLKKNMRPAEIKNLLWSIVRGNNE